ncbi:FapA family protein [Calditrichota bacterium]
MIKIALSKNKFEALISIQAEKDFFTTESQIKTHLKQEGIVFGVDDELIKDLVKNKNPVTDIVIANGNLPVPGKNAELIWSIEIYYSSKPTITDTDKADFKQLKLFERISKNQVLASKLPASEGIPGKNVFGEEIVEGGADLKFPAGKNTRISEDGLTMFSTIDGFAFWENDLLHIDNIYQINGNVDYHTGNISASGTVMIEGDVRSGFRVEATESILIGGNVEAASLYSQNGDISIQCGILGGGRAKILSGGNLTCGFIQDATISAKKDIEIKHYVFNSMVSAGGAVKLKENEGLVRGGSISSGKGITAKEVGSAQKIYTELNVRLHSQDESTTHFWELAKNQKELKRTLDALQRRASFIHLLQDRIEDLSSEKKQELNSLKIEIEETKKKINDYEKKEIEIRKEVSEKTFRSEIKILQNLHPNVKIDIGNLEYFSQNLLSNIRLFCVDNEIIIEKLNDNYGHD